MAERVVFVVERGFADARVFPGAVHRCRRLEQWIKDDAAVRGPEVVEVTTSGESRYRRVRKVVEARHNLIETTSPADTIVVAALGSPQMLWLAYVTSRRRLVQVDVCDSIVETLRGQALSRQFVASFITVASLFLLRIMAGPRLTVSYISDVDARSDRFLVGRCRRVMVIGPDFPAELVALPPSDGSVKRLVLPVDLNSRHNRGMVDWLLRKIDDRTINLKVPLVIYGPAAPTKLPVGVHYEGWAERRIDVYDQGSVIVAPNLHSPGVQNKVLEAVAAARYCIASSQATSRFPSNGGIMPFGSPAELAQLLSSVGQSRLPVLSRGTVGAWPREAPGVLQS